MIYYYLSGLKLKIFHSGFSIKVTCGLLPVEVNFWFIDLWINQLIILEFGTLHMEFSYLSDITGNPVYKEKVEKIRDFISKTERYAFGFTWVCFYWIIIKPQPTLKINFCSRVEGMFIFSELRKNGFFCIKYEKWRPASQIAFFYKIFKHNLKFRLFMIMRKIKKLYSLYSCSRDKEEIVIMLHFSIKNDDIFLIGAQSRCNRILLWIVHATLYTGCPKKHGNSVTNLISSLLWISIVIPIFLSHNIIMFARFILW